MFFRIYYLLFLLNNLQLFYLFLQLENILSGQVFGFFSNSPYFSSQSLSFVAVTPFLDPHVTVPINLCVLQSSEAMETDAQESPGDVQNLIQHIESEITRFQTLVTNEDDKMIRYKVRRCFGHFLKAF